MPAERGLMTPGVGLFGKHPAFGDFINAGSLPAALPAGMMEWLASALGPWRDAAGPGWEEGFDHAPALRFWAGAGCAAGAAVRGVMVPSRDRTGRRFPLVIAQAPGGGGPFAGGDDSFHDRAEGALASLAGLDQFEPQSAAAQLADDMPLPEGLADTPTGATFWAINPQRSPAELMAELAGTEIRHAQAGRSYWWFRGDAGGAGLMGCAGWPDPAQLGWLLAGGRAATQTTAQSAAEAIA